MNRQLYLIVNIIILLFIAAILGIQFVGVRRMRNKLGEIRRCKSVLNEMEHLIDNYDNKEDVYNIILTTVVNGILGKGDKAWLAVRGKDNKYYYEACIGYEERLYNGKYLDDNIKFNNVVLSREILFSDSQIVLPMICDKELIAIINIEIKRDGKKFNKRDKKLLQEVWNELAVVIKNFRIKEEFKYIATHDVLTDLYNRRYFTETFKDELNIIKKDKGRHYLGVIDLDNFKDINDLYGHNQGDIAIKNMANAMRNILGENDIYARLSGDEFITLFKDQSYEEVEEKISNMKEYLSRIEGNTKLDFSYGLVEIHYKDDINKEELFSIADKAMYENKKSKKIER